MNDATSLRVDVHESLWASEHAALPAGPWLRLRCNWSPASKALLFSRHLLGHQSISLPVELNIRRVHLKRPVQSRSLTVTVSTMACHDIVR